jgi:Leishmanolysin
MLQQSLNFVSMNRHVQITRFRRQNAVRNLLLEGRNGTGSNSSIYAVAPIRIRYDTRLIEMQIGGDADVEINTILTEILPQVAKTLAGLLYIAHPYNTTSEITVSKDECEVYSQLVDNTTAFPNVTFSDADLVVIVGGDLEGNCAPRELAYARPCSLDLQTDRPIVGKLEFCLGNQRNVTLQPSIYGIPLAPYYETFTGVTFHADHLQISLIDITLHETIHILGFSSQLYPYFRDAKGAPRTPRGADGEPVAVTRVCGDGENITSTNVPSEKTVQVVPMDDGSFHQYLVTPKVQAIVRNHFNCPSLLGGRLADISSSSCIASHWHERMAYGDLMGPKASRSSENTLSLMTLALLADSGWYKVNFSNAPPPPAFGLNAGCNFVSQPCIDNTTDRVPDWVANEFCDIPYLRLKPRNETTAPVILNHNTFCDPSYRSWTLCDLVQYEDGSIPVKSYFSSSSHLAPLNITVADFCPIPDVGLGLDCRRGDNYSYPAFYPGESVGEGSRCINAFHIDRSASNNVTHRPACMLVTCDAKAGVVRIGSGKQVHNCTADGEEITLSNGSFLQCPRLAAVCPKLFTCPNGCFGNGQCIHDGSRRPFCRCFNASNVDVSCAPTLFATLPASAPSFPSSVKYRPPTRAPFAPSSVESRSPSFSNQSQPIDLTGIVSSTGSELSGHHNSPNGYTHGWIFLVVLLATRLQFY